MQPRNLHVASRDRLTSPAIRRQQRREMLEGIAALVGFVVLLAIGTYWAMQP